MNTVYSYPESTLWGKTGHASAHNAWNAVKHFSTGRIGMKYIWKHSLNRGASFTMVKNTVTSNILRHQASRQAGKRFERIPEYSPRHPCGYQNADAFFRRRFRRSIRYLTPQFVGRLAPLNRHWAHGRGFDSSPIDTVT